MSDAEARELERAAADGDQEARDRLAVLEARAGRGIGRDASSLLRHVRPQLPERDFATVLSSVAAGDPGDKARWAWLRVRDARGFPYGNCGFFFLSRVRRDVRVDATGRAPLLATPGASFATGDDSSGLVRLPRRWRHGLHEHPLLSIATDRYEGFVSVDGDGSWAACRVCGWAPEPGRLRARADFDASVAEHVASGGGSLVCSVEAARAYASLFAA